MKKFLINVQEDQSIVHVEKPDWIGVFGEAIADCEAEEINNWVHQSNLGRRIAYDRWRLKDRTAVSAFLLKWG